MNITHSTAPRRIRVLNRAHARMVIAREQADGRHVATYHEKVVSVSRAPQRRVQTAQVWQLGAALIVAAGLAIYSGSSHAEDMSGCDAAPAVLVRHTAMSYAPHRPAIHRHRLPAALRAPEVGCTRESLPAAVAPLPVPAAEEVLAPAIAEVAPAVLETPRAAVAAAAAGSNGAAVPIGVLVAGVAICFLAGPCDGHGNTTGGRATSTTGTTATTGTF